MNKQVPPTDQPELEQERWELLRQIDAMTDKPMTVLSFIWLGLLILDFTLGLSRLLLITSYVIWALFVLDFIIEFTIAPRKLDYLRRRWLTALSLLLPAFRVLRVVRALGVLRAARAARSVSLLRLITSLNRGMRAVSTTLGRRGIGYVVVLTAIVTFAGAAGMYLFERSVAQGDVGLDTYGEAVWWTAMIMTTLGSEYWPKTAEGRILGWLLSVYALAIFGYITATIASYFIGRDVAAGQAEPTTPSEETAETIALREEIAALREQIAALVTQLEATHAVQPSDKGK
jgi:voltage-gated potassium channel